MQAGSRPVGLSGAQRLSSPVSELALPHGVLFDFDRTLVELFPTDWPLKELAVRVRRIYESAGCPTDMMPTAVQNDGYLAWYWMHGEANLRGLPVAPLSEAAEELVSQAELQAAVRGRPLPGAISLLRLLINHRIVVGIVTSNADRAVAAALHRLGLNTYVRGIIGRPRPLNLERMKPNAHPILSAMSQLGIRNARCWFIGDSRDDIIGASKAGCVTIGVATGNTAAIDLRSAGADLVLEGLETVELLFKSLEAEDSDSRAKSPTSER